MADQVETPVGVAERWAAYIEAALTHVLIVIEHQNGSRLVATAPGFDGWVLPLDAQPDLVHQVTVSLEHWLEYRLANHLTIPMLPGAETPTLDDLEEYDCRRAADRGHRLLATDTPRPMEEVFAEIEAAR